MSQLRDEVEQQLYNAFIAAKAGDPTGLATQLEWQVYNAIIAAGGISGGEGGGTGIPAGFGTPTITVDDGVGTPSAMVTATGPNTAKVFSFAFRNLKGEPGVTGQTGTKGTTFTPSVSSAGVLSWTNDGGKTNPQSVNIKGPQGEPGPAGTVDPTAVTAEVTAQIAALGLGTMANRALLTGNGEPAASLGSNGDFYVQLDA